jgi:sugar lactone lactonase YvrE
MNCSRFFQFFISFLIFFQLTSTNLSTCGAIECEVPVDREIALPLVAGAMLPSSNGIAFNLKDELFVASVVDRSITQLHPRNGRILARLSPEQGVEAPDDLAFDTAGNLYWTAFLTGDVGRMTPEGDTTTIANLGPGVNAITVSDDDSKLYVSRVFLADEVWELDLTGINPPRLLAQDLGGFNGMDIGPDGKLYGPLCYHGQIARIDTTTGNIDIVTEGLTAPAAVKFSHTGDLFVVDTALGEVLHVNLTNGALKMIAEVGIGSDNLAFDSHDHLYVSNAHDSNILRVFNVKGGLHDWHPVHPLTRGGLSTSSGIALHKINGRTSLFVADIYSIREYSPHSGSLRSTAHSIMGGVTQLSTPFSLSSYGNYLVTTSWFANSVQIWDPELQTLVDEHLDFALPLNAIGFGEDILIAELGSGCVMRRPANTSDSIPLACDFKVPAGLAENDGKVWVSDWATGSVWQIAENYIALESPILVTKDLIQPEGLAAAKHGTLLVVEAGASRLLEINFVTGNKRTRADKLPLGNSATPGYPPTWIFNSVAVDDCGVAYMNLDGDRSVRRIVN